MDRAALRGLVVTFGAVLIVTLACPLPGEFHTSYLCKPSSASPETRCPAAQLCCSNDPAAIDLAAPELAMLPSYELETATPGAGLPLFAGARNDESEWGVCIEIGSVAPAYALDNGCPIPCNPRWDGAAIDSVCGQGFACCQTTELDESDCVLDPTLGDDGCWRPIHGDDIDGLGGPDLTDWGTHTHATHQDPGGVDCERFVSGLTSDALDGAGVTADELLRGCLRKLGAADQRGFCLRDAYGCPLAQPSYRDACEQLNDEQARAGCE